MSSGGVSSRKFAHQEHHEHSPQAEYRMVNDKRTTAVLKARVDTSRFSGPKFLPQNGRHGIAHEVVQGSTGTVRIHQTAVYLPRACQRILHSFLCHFLEGNSLNCFALQLNLCSIVALCTVYVGAQNWVGTHLVGFVRGSPNNSINYSANHV